MSDQTEAAVLSSNILQDTDSGLSLALNKGPFQNNGASPWYASLVLGTAKEGTAQQTLKFSLDTGSNFVWVTSTLCDINGCQHYGNEQFNYNDSSSFQWLSQQSISVSFGPWGTMEVETGNDYFTLNDEFNVSSDLYLAKSYSGDQFEELDWDGGIGVPSSYSGSLHAKSTSFIRGHFKGKALDDEAATFSLFQSLMNQGAISPDKPFLAFDTDPVSKSGTVTMGQLDSDYQDCLEYLYLPFEIYPTVNYVWTAALKSIKVGDTELGANVYFCLDSGSSQFKGDVGIMEQAYKMTSCEGCEPLVTLALAQSDSAETGILEIPADIYKVKIEAGDKSGQVVSQFQSMDGVDGLVLVGSVLMDYLYTVYEYSVEQGTEGYELNARGMWIFNKKAGPRIIQNTQSEPARIFTNKK